MRIQRIVLILLFICLCVAAQAQDVIVTKDSRHIQAEIIEVSPSVVRYKVYGKPNAPVTTISIKEVESITYESDIEPEETEEDFNYQKNPHKKARRQAYISGTAFHAYIESEFSYNFKYSLFSIDPLKVTLGAQFGDYVFAGAGAGGTIFTKNIAEKGYELLGTDSMEYYDEISRYKLSAFGVIRLTKPINEKVVPFLNIEGGVSVCRREWTEEWFAAPYFSAGLGISISHFEISAGYEHFAMPVDRMYKPYREWTYFTEDSHANGALKFGNIFVKIGAKIGYLKQ